MKAPTRWEMLILPLTSAYWRAQYGLFEWLLARMERVYWLHHYARPWEIVERLAGHGCMHTGCRRIGEAVYIGWDDSNDGEVSDAPSGYYCDAHVHAAGFCANCRKFFGGFESFDFGNGLCDDCNFTAQLEETKDDYERAFDDDGDEDDPDSGGWRA